MKSLILSAGIGVAVFALVGKEGSAAKLHLVRPIASRLTQKLSETTDKLVTESMRLGGRGQAYLQETAQGAKASVYGAAHLAKMGTKRSLTNFRSDPKRSLRGIGDSAYHYRYPIAVSLIIGGKMLVLPLLLGQPAAAHGHEHDGGGFWQFWGSIPDRIDNALDGNCYDFLGQYVCGDHHGGDHNGGGNWDGHNGGHDQKGGDHHGDWKKDDDHKGGDHGDWKKDDDHKGDDHDDWKKDRDRDEHDD